MLPRARLDPIGKESAEDSSKGRERRIPVGNGYQGIDTCDSLSQFTPHIRYIATRKQPQPIFRHESRIRLPEPPFRRLF